jgi:hypothetical protein
MAISTVTMNRTDDQDIVIVHLWMAAFFAPRNPLLSRWDGLL